MQVHLSILIPKYKSILFKAQKKWLRNSNEDFVPIPSIE